VHLPQWQSLENVGSVFTIKVRQMNRTRAFLILAATATLIPSAAHGTRWVLITKSESRTYYVDMDAIVFDGPVATIWLRTELTTVGKKGEAFSIEKWLHDCENDRAKLLALTIYKSNGRVMSSGQSPRYREDWQSFPANSEEGLLHRRICQPTVQDGNARNTPVIVPSTT
jgi:hypothetical protein